MTKILYQHIKNPPHVQYCVIERCNVWKSVLSVLLERSSELSPHERPGDRTRAKSALSPDRMSARECPAYVSSLHLLWQKCFFFCVSEYVRTDVEVQRVTLFLADGRCFCPLHSVIKKNNSILPSSLSLVNSWYLYQTVLLPSQRSWSSVFLSSEPAGQTPLTQVMVCFS